MESKLDDKYYQKYMQYKNKYLMLKQFKNNNDLEGGMFGFFGTNETSTAKPISKILNDAATDGVYLVFNIKDINKDSHKYVVDQNLEINKVRKSEFNIDNKDKAFIITKQGTKFICKIITDDINKNIESLLTKMKEELYLNDNQNNQDLKLCIEKFNNYSDKITDILKQQNTNDKINTEISSVYKSFIERSNNIKTMLSENNTKLKDAFNKILLSSEYKKYNEFDFDFKSPFTKTYSQDFFKLLTDTIQIKTRNTVALNMIIKITETADEYVFEKRGIDSISRTPMYNKIDKHRVNSEPIAPALESTSAAESTSAPATESPPASDEAAK
jgi:hypothetical protein